MLSEISALINGVKGLTDIVKGLKSANDHMQIQEAVMSLQSAILDLQTQAFEANDSYTELEAARASLAAQVAHLTEWKAESQKFEARNLAENILVYVPKQGSSLKDVLICPYCFGSKKISFLLRKDINASLLSCHSCNWTCNPVVHSSAGFFTDDSHYDAF